MSSLFLDYTRLVVEQVRCVPNEQAREDVATVAQRLGAAAAWGDVVRFVGGGGSGSGAGF